MAPAPERTAETRSRLPESTRPVRSLAFHGALVACVTSLWLLVGPGLDTTKIRPFGDGRAYLTMARWSGTGRTPPHIGFPHRFRILTPWIAHLLPLDPLLGFQLLTLVCLVAFASLLRTISRELGAPSREAMFGSFLCLSLFFPVIYSVVNPYMADPLTLVLLALGALFIFQHRPGPLLATLAIGALNKEVILVLVPVVLVSWVSERSRLKTRWMVLAILVPAVVLWVLWYRFGAETGLDSAAALIPRWTRATIANPKFGQSVVHGFLRSGGPLMLLPILMWKSLPTAVRRSVLAGLLGVVPLVFLVEGSGRQMAMFLPIGLPAFVIALTSLNLKRSPFTAVVALTLAGNLILARIPPVPTGPHTGVWNLIAVVLLVGAVLLAVLQRTSPQSIPSHTDPS